MNKFIALFVGSAIAALLAASAYGQAAGPVGGGVQSTGGAGAQQKGGARGPVAPKLLKQLDLTKDQEKQIRTLATNFVQQRENLAPAGTKPNPRQLAPLRRQFMEDLAKILTPAQQTKLKELMTEARKQKKGVLPGGGNAGAGSGAGTGGTKTGGG